MKHFIHSVCLLLCLSSYGQVSTFMGKTWAYKRITLTYNQKTLVLFESDSTKNIWYLGRINFVFKPNNIYTGTAIDGATQMGTWSVLNNTKLIIDSDTTNLINKTDNSFSTSNLATYNDQSVNIVGTVVINFVAVPPATSTCFSIQSGNWSDASTWSCGHEPTLNDLVVINPTHTISITPNTAQAQRIIYNGGSIKFSAPTSKVRLGNP